MTRLQYLAEVNPPTTEFDALPSDVDVSFLPLEAVWADHRVDLSRTRSKEEVSSGYTRFRDGDIILPKITPTFQADRATIVRHLRGGVGAGTTELHVIRPRPVVDSRYIRYLLSSRPFLLGGAASMIGVAGQKRVPEEWVRNFRVPITDVVKQRAIADFLDRETTRIDALVEKKRRLIALLVEHRISTITQAITKGLDRSAPMADSHIPWLGRIPEHWKTGRIRHLGEVIMGLTYDPADVVTDGDDGTLVLRASNIRAGRIALDDNVFVRGLIPDRLRTRRGDILVCARSGSRALVGKSAFIDEDSRGLSFGAFMLVLRSEIDDFLFFVLNSTLFEQQSSAFSTATINQLTVGDLKDIAVPLPPRDEQVRIVEFLTRKVAQIDRLIGSIETAADSLNERRQALITRAVTGQLEISEAA